MEQNPFNPQNQVELETKKQQLKDLESKEKSLTKLLPINTQITILEQEISNLESKSNKTPEEQFLLETKKQELAKLLKEENKNTSTENKKGDKVALYIGLGIVGMVLVSVLVILVKKSKKKRGIH